MPIGTPTERFTFNGAFNGTTQTINPASNITAGTEVFLMGHSSNADWSSVSDSVGNSWTINHKLSSGGTDFNAIASARVATAITTTDTISITYSLAGNFFRSYWVYEVSGLSTSPYDQVVDDNDTNPMGTSFTSGTTPTLGQNDEIIWANIYVSDIVTFTPTGVGTWTGATTNALGQQNFLYYQIATSSSPATLTGTWNRGDRSNYSFLATYKQTSPDTVNPAPVLYGRGAC